VAESIETFVEKLKTEGVDAGKKEAERISAEAKAEADAIVARAKEEAARLVAGAKAEAEQERQRGKTELELASRDAMLKLRDAVTKVVEAMLARASSQAVEDPAWIQKTLGDLVRLWAEGEQKGEDGLSVHVNEKTRAQLVDWALKAAPALALKNGLTQAGFAWEDKGGVVEVTAESITATLRELVSPELQRLVDAAGGSKPR